MAELIDSFDSSGIFDRYPYFSVCFDQLPSSLGFETPLKMDRALMEKVLETVDFASQEMQVVFKYWNTEDTKEADFSEDFPYRYLLKSKAKKLLIWLSLEFDQLFVDMLYDASDLELEKWVIATNHKLRMTFGLNRSPIFNVLSRNDNGFFKEEVKTDNFECDIQKMYNDDFEAINELIENALEVDKAGLILLHGLPGTGKTSYIKNLISRHHKKSFIFIQNDFVNELLHPNFISFLLKNQNAVLIIEDAEKVLTSREQVNETSVVSTILQLTDGLFSDYLNIKIICTFNTSIDKIDKALLRKGRMIAYYEFQPLIPEKADELLRGLNHESNGTEMTLADIFNYKKKDFNQTKKGKIGFQK
ncbi:AAA family ATPase [Cyclobacterium plantarum]|uniref:AAA family ATPase n=1 Tax=Cyclobacterium plantarum TaxID=2716263 RepID=UPI003F6FB90D